MSFDPGAEGEPSLRTETSAPPASLQRSRIGAKPPPGSASMPSKTMAWMHALCLSGPAEHWHSLQILMALTVALVSIDAYLQQYGSDLSRACFPFPCSNEPHSR